RGEVLAANGTWESVEFLADIGADRSVLTAALFTVLGYESVQTDLELNGLGGTARVNVAETQIRLTDVHGRKVVFRGSFAAAGDGSALDIAVIGRDITNLFAVIIDWPGDVVCLLRGNDRYQIVGGAG
ncbi:MAG TPA: hypothetical protein VF278_05575, partial [Pirellulales bacterium]